MDSFTVHIETQNAVFDDNNELTALAELFHKLAHHLQDGEIPSAMRDGNGNTVLRTYIDIDPDDCCRIGGFTVE